MLRETISTEIFTILMLVSLLLIAVAKLSYPKRFQDFTSIIINNRYIRLYTRDQKLFDGFETILFLNLTVSLSAFGFICYNQLNPDVILSTGLILELAIAVAVFLLTKVLIERFISRVFNIDTIINNYLFQKINYKNFIGIILVPLNALLVYSLSPNKTLLISIIGVLILINYIGLSYFFKNNLSIIKKNFFYFILYLCILEISPYLVLYKLITAN